MYDKLGGKEKIKAICTTLFGFMQNDPKLSHFFHYTNPLTHIDRLSEFLSYLVGGHEEWTGHSIEVVHSGRFISY